MGYPSISQYIESVSNAFGLFRTLGEIDADRDLYGQVRFTTGSNAVIVRFRQEGSAFLLKCPLKHHPHRRRIYDYITEHPDSLLSEARLLPEEIYVYDPLDNGAYYDVVVARWVEGCTLEAELRRAVRQNDRAGLATLAQQFDRLATALLRREWAHGDLKPDNIIVTPDGSLRLIDYDAMFIPNLAGERTCELGTPPFQHPLRDEYFYDKHLDDYSIALLSTSLHALALEPSLYGKYHRADNLLLFPEEILSDRSPAYEEILHLFLHHGAHASYRMSQLLRSPMPQIDTLPALLERMTSPAHSSATPALHLFEENGRLGYRSSSGEIVIEAIYDDASEFREGMAVVRCGSHYQVIDSGGHVVLNGTEYEIIKPFHEGLAAVCKKGRWGYIDSKGNMIIEPRFEMAGNMHQGMAVIRLNGKYGYIGKDGIIAIAPKFDRASGFRNGRAEVEYLGESFFINILAKIV